MTKAAGQRQATHSEASARALLRERRSQVEIDSLLITTRLVLAASPFLRELFSGFDWVAETRARLTHVEDPPPAVLKALDLGPVTEEETAHLAELPAAETMRDQINAALEFAGAVRRARDLLPATAMFGRGGTGWPAALSAFAKMPPEDLAAGILLIGSASGFCAKFSATEAMAFAVLTHVEGPTAEPEQRLNTWSKRLLRVAKHIDPTLVNLGKAHFEIVSRRVAKLGDGAAVAVTRAFDRMSE